METLGKLVIIGGAGWLLYTFFKKREAQLKAKLAAALADVKTTIKEVEVPLFPNPDLDNWHN